jgi:hypothetical protein
MTSSELCITVCVVRSCVDWAAKGAWTRCSAVLVVRPSQSGSVGISKVHNKNKK